MPGNTTRRTMHGIPKAITVLIPTYNRTEILYQTITRLREYLVFEGEVRITIGDDGDSDLVNDRFYDLDVGIVPGPMRGLGANLNRLLERVETNIVMQMDDDHWLTERLNINDYARDLLNPDFNIGWVRLFMGERHDVYSLDTYYKIHAATHGPYWYMSPDSPELYLASNRPHLKHIDFHRKHYGFYPEERSLGKTEEAWCHQYKKLRMANRNWSAMPWVVVPMLGLNINQWQHVGESWQRKGL